MTICQDLNILAYILSLTSASCNYIYLYQPEEPLVRHSSAYIHYNTSPILNCHNAYVVCAASSINIRRQKPMMNSASPLLHDKPDPMGDAVGPVPKGDGYEIMC